MLQTEAFADWLAKLRAGNARIKILARIKRLAHGNFGDAEPVGNGVSEMRVHVGPGYRVYFVQRGPMLVVLLCGGDKASQGKDILRAKAMAAELEDSR